MKTCTKCGITKELSLFIPNKKYALGVTAWCRNCSKAYDNAWKTKNKVKINSQARERCKNPITNKSIKSNKLKHRYKITMEDYEFMLAKQGGGCGICGITFNLKAGKKSSFCVDHNHVTGKIRGLLCFKCNYAIGALCVDYRGILFIDYARNYLLTTDHSNIYYLQVAE